MLCPICKKEVARTDPFMPFCSKRCTTIDLGNWATEKYVISTPAPQRGDSDFDVERDSEDDAE
ncbi:MAG: DNA gyrase inhibitor YacG [Bryobacteraceae bacterium]